MTEWIKFDLTNVRCGPFTSPHTKGGILTFDADCADVCFAGERLASRK
jgi:hypothetical protein